MKQNLFIAVALAFVSSSAVAAGSPHFVCQVDQETLKPFTLEQNPTTYNHEKTLLDSKGLKVSLFYMPARPDIGYNTAMMMLQAESAGMKVNQQTQLPEANGGVNLQIETTEAGNHVVICLALKDLPPGF